jgi:hypothetical protein
MRFTMYEQTQHKVGCLRKHHGNEFWDICPMTIAHTLFVPNTKNEDKCITPLFLDPQESKKCVTLLLKNPNQNPGLHIPLSYSISTQHGLGVTNMRTTTVLITQILDITAKLKGQYCIIKMTKYHHKYCECTSSLDPIQQNSVNLTPPLHITRSIHFSTKHVNTNCLCLCTMPQRYIKSMK